MNKKENEKRTTEYSKILATVSMILFIFAILFGCISMTYLILSNSASYLDLGFYLGIVTVTGGIYGMTNKHYYSKSGLQNVATIRKESYKEIKKVQVQYVKEILQLQKEFEVDKDEIDMIQNDSPFPNMSEMSLNNLNNKIDEVDTVNAEEPEVQTF